MKYLMIAFLLFSMHLVAFSQQSRFVFLESASRQPFYVRMGERSFSSSAFGHLVIPKLGDSTYTFSIGFPRNQFPEQDFRISLDGKDRGFDLKIVNGNQVNLYDWQRSQTLLPLNPPAAALPKGGNFIRRTDAYAVLMAGVVNDSLVLMAELSVEDKKTEVVAKTESSPSSAREDSNLVTVQPVKQDSALVKNSKAADSSIASHHQDSSTSIAAEKQTAPANIAENHPEPAKVAENHPAPANVAENQTAPDTVSVVAGIEKEEKANPSTSSIMLLNEKTGPEKKTLYYLDGSGSVADTIDVVILKEAVAGAKDELPAQNAEAGTVKEDQDNKSGIVLMNSDCKRFADDQDLDRLRISLLKQDDDDERILAAKKVFRTRCFSTKQVKALTELFKTEGAKYTFLDAAYPFVSDSGNFKTLVDLFSDPYYVNRFKALVRM